MVRRLIQRICVIGIVAVVTSNAAMAITSANTVPATHSGVITSAITANNLKPAVCSGITITNLAVGSGTVTGTKGQSNLILGSAANDKLGHNGGGWGPDCCVGGGGTNTFRASCAVSVP